MPQISSWPLWSIFSCFLRLGCYSFGGPIAHLGYYHRAFVQERHWLKESEFSQMVAIAQFLPGPTSCQTNFMIGWHRAGVVGGVAAFCGFVLPSALLMLLLAGSSQYWLEFPGVSGVLQGLKIAALVIIFQALWGMSERLCPDRWRQSLALLVLMAQLYNPGLATQMLSLIAAGACGLLLAKRLPAHSEDTPLRLTQPRGLALTCLALFLVLLALLPLLSNHNPLFQVIDSFYRSGALVFGGGHVVLPLLQTELVASGRLSLDQFLLGYASAQALPGPLFTLAGFLGVLESGLLGGVLALIAIFLPGLLLLIALLPSWNRLQAHPVARGLLAGVNAAVVGLLASALAGPVTLSAIQNSQHLLLAICAALLLWRWGLKALLPGLALAGALFCS